MKEVIDKRGNVTTPEGLRRQRRNEWEERIRDEAGRALFGVQKTIERMIDQPWHETNREMMCEAIRAKVDEMRCAGHEEGAVVLLFCLEQFMTVNGDRIFR